MDHKGQHRLPGKDFDIHKVDVDIQLRFYHEANPASKQGGEGQKYQTKGNMDAHNGAISGSRQYEGGHGHPAGIQQGTSVDPADYRETIPQQEFHGSQIPQHQNQRPGYLQGPNVDHSGYGYNARQQQFQGSQIPQQQTPQQGYNYDQGSNVDLVYNTGQQQFRNPQAPHHHQGQQPGYHQAVSHHQSQSNAHLSYPQPDPAAQMAHIPRAGLVEDNAYHYNPATSMPYNYIGNTGHGSHRPVHQYEPVPRSVYQPDPYRQQRQQNPNPYNLEIGSMILYGDPPHAGMVKWIGHLPKTKGNFLLAGIELVGLCLA